MGLNRLVAAFYDEIATSFGLRIITPDRPGIGLSDEIRPSPKKVLAWAGTSPFRDQSNKQMTSWKSVKPSQSNISVSLAIRSVQLMPSQCPSAYPNEFEVESIFSPRGSPSHKSMPQRPCSTILQWTPHACPSLQPIDSSESSLSLSSKSPAASSRKRNTMERATG